MVQIQRQLSPAQPVLALSSQGKRTAVGPTVDTFSPQFSAKRRRLDQLPTINNILLATFCYVVVSGITSLWKGKILETRAEDLSKRIEKDIKFFDNLNKRIIYIGPHNSADNPKK